MDIPPIPPWPTDEAGARAEQERLRGLLEDGPGDAQYRLVTGVDVSYGDDKLVAAAVTIDTTTMETVEEATREGVARFPYVPGLLAFRELPTLLDALAGLSAVPDLLVCDGHGIAHPR
ncbi:MAG TPA: endonuclease V, partial [Phytomonospora sp.]